MHRRAEGKRIEGGGEGSPDPGIWRWEKRRGGCFCAQLSCGLLLSLSEETKSWPESRRPDRPGNESRVPEKAGLLGGEGRPVPADVAGWPEAG